MACVRVECGFSCFELRNLVSAIVKVHCGIDDYGSI